MAQILKRSTSFQRQLGFGQWQCRDVFVMSRTFAAVEKCTHGSRNRSLVLQGKRPCSTHHAVEGGTKTIGYVCKCAICRCQALTLLKFSLRSPPITSRHISTKSGVEKTSQEKSLISRRRTRNLSPGGRLSALLPEDYWQSQTDVSKKSVSLLDKQTLPSERTAINETSSVKSEESRSLTSPASFCSQPFQWGEFVLLKRVNQPKGVGYLQYLQLDKACKISREYGEVWHHDIVDQEEYSIVESSTGKEMILSRPTLEEYLSRLHWLTKVANAKTLSKVVSYMGVQNGDRVLEAGSGSGVSAIILSSLVGANGEIESVEINPHNWKGAKRNFSRWTSSYSMINEEPWPQNVTFLHSELANYTCETPFDMIFLDITDVNQAVLDSWKHLKPGKKITVYSPNVSRLVDIHESIQREKLPLIAENVWEVTNKQWRVYINKNSKSLALGSSSQWEEETAFLGSFRRCQEDWPSMETAAGALKEGDEVIVSSVGKSKVKPLTSKVFPLMSGSTFNNHWGNLKHDSIIGQQEGTILKTVTGTDVYVHRASFMEYMNHTCKGLPVSSYQFEQLVHLLAVRPGQNVLEIGKSILSLFISQKVREKGSVHSLVSGSEANENLRTPLDVAGMRNEIRGRHPDWLAGEIHCHCADDPLPDSFRNMLLDAICVTQINVDSDIGFLSAAVNQLKTGGTVCFLCRRISLVQQALDYVHQSELSLKLVDILEDHDREWLLRPLRKEMNKEKGVMPRPGLCRPKHRSRNFIGCEEVPAFISVFIARFRKVGDKTSQQNMQPGCS